MTFEMVETPTGYESKATPIRKGELYRKPNTMENLAMVIYAVGEEGTNNFKVGVTKSPKTLRDRVVVMQAGNPRPLSVLWFKEVEGEGRAFHLEQMTHITFADKLAYPMSEWLVDMDLDHVTAYIDSL